jgi:sigma-B regulation protein RsbU (phosphoserine phosphatase)
MAPSDAQRRLAELTTLNELAQALNRAVDFRDALDSTIARIVQLLGLRTGWIYLYESGYGYRVAARVDLPPAILYPGPIWHDSCECQDLCDVGRMNRNGQLVRCTRLRAAVGDKRSLSHHLSMPLYDGDELLGILNLATNEYANFSPAQMQLLSALGHVLSTAITRQRLHEQVRVRRVQEQAALLQLSQDMLGGVGLESALQRLVRVGARLLEVDACAFVEADEHAGCARLLVAHGWNFVTSTALPIVLDEQNPHLWYLPEQSLDLAADALSDLPRLLGSQRFVAHLAVTIKIGAVPVGLLMVNDRRARRFDENEQQLLELLGSQLAQTLERERLHQEALAHQRLEQELDLARDIQESFLPAAAPQVAGYQVAAFYRAARQVGGDFYDFIVLPQTPSAPEAVPISEVPSFPRKPNKQLPPVRATDRLGVVIGDVTGKGVPAALFMVLSRTLLRANASDGRTPQQVLEQTNRLLLADARTGMFVTAFYGILDLASHAFVYASGGHNYPLVYRAATGQVEQLAAQGIVLGVIDQPVFEQKQVQLDHGDLLCLYTDGVTEAMDARRHLFDEQRLIDILKRSHHLAPDQIIERIIDAVLSFTGSATQGDDITLTIIKRNGCEIR